MIVRHGWVYSKESSAWVCMGLQPVSTKYYDCFGCGVSISRSEHSRNRSTENPLWWGNNTGASVLDKLWHEKLRPMAALACLVEEASE